MVTSRPFFSKMPASLASVSGAKPVHRKCRWLTLVLRNAGLHKSAAASAVATILTMFSSV